MPKTIKQITKHKEIFIKGARVHNLKNIDVRIPRNKLTVITGVSGSGKSSLAFDTLYAEGQRRYVESLSSYARQFLGKINKPDVDKIDGISPAIAIEQKVISRNSRSTVGTTTEIYDYLKILYSRIGKTISPISGNIVTQHKTSDAVDYIKTLPTETRIIILAPFERRSKDLSLDLNLIKQLGYLRIYSEGETLRVDSDIDPKDIKDIKIVVDRITADPSEENLSRIGDSIETAFIEGKGYISLIHDETTTNFSNQFELDGMRFEVPSIHFFTFNNPVGACTNCEGFGSVIDIDPTLVIPDKTKSVYEDAIACWRGDKMSLWKNKLIKNAATFDFPIHKPIKDLTNKQFQLLWTGNKYFKGIDAFFKHVESKSYKIQYRVLLSRYRGKTKCKECNGARLRKDAQYVKVGDKSITEVSSMSIESAAIFFDELSLSKFDSAVANRILVEIKNRLQYLLDVGLGYLTLNRMSNTLSGGESQRINLATSVGSSLVGSTYILDEPSIGLHPKDTIRLIKVLTALRDLGNTVVVVEHDEEIMMSADHIIDIGPMAGQHGGELVFSGNHKELLNAKNSLTADYLTKKKVIEVPNKRRPWKEYIEIKGARENNLQDITVKIPLNVITAITGVSGSGKTTLVKTILYPALNAHLGGIISAQNRMSGEFDAIKGSMNRLNAVEMVSQNPIGKSSRSNPVTYIKAYDEIRKLFSKQQESIINGYKPAHFSFNVKGGRCEQCEGDGKIKVSMQFMADISLVCDECEGKKFKDEILRVRYQDKNIYEVLEMTIDEAIDFFEADKRNKSALIVNKLKTLQEVGMGYVKLGQSSSTLSGGEAQRIKLAFFLSKRETRDKTLFIFDEPTTGLHFNDVKKLIAAMNSLVERGHSVIVIEHNMDLVKISDWVIDLGPGGGEHGGRVVFEGTPEDLSKSKTATGAFMFGKC